MKHPIMKHSIVKHRQRVLRLGLFGLLLMAALGSQGCDWKEWIASMLLEPGVGAVPGKARSPKDWGVPGYEKIEVKTRDGVQIRGWYLPHPKSRGRTIVVCHGLGGSRWDGAGMALGLYWKGAYNVVLFDFRRHGRSQKTYFTYGYYERNDLYAIASWLVKKGTKQIGVLGWSAGAAIALQAAPKIPGIRGVFSINAFSSLYQAALARKPSFVPRSKLLEGLRYAEKRGRFTVAKTSPLAAVKATRIPTLFAVGDRDRTIPPSHSRQLAKAAGPKGRLWVLRGYGHNNWWRHPQFSSRLLAFFQQQMP